MNAHEEKPVVITEEDYQLLKPYISSIPAHNEMSLSSELQRAIVVAKDAFPRHTVRINSKVTVLELNTNKVLEFTIVMPAHADMHQNKISILTPMAAALIGFRKAEEVQWKVPGGWKRFRILDVVNRD